MTKKEILQAAEENSMNYCIQRGMAKAAFIDGALWALKKSKELLENKKRCKNCAYCFRTKDNDCWCSQYINYTSADSCCIKHKSEFPLSASSVIALVIALIGLVVSMLALTNVI